MFVVHRAFLALLLPIVSVCRVARPICTINGIFLSSGINKPRLYERFRGYDNIAYKIKQVILNLLMEKYTGEKRE
jgi:hypothetical protein